MAAVHDRVAARTEETLYEVRGWIEAAGQVMKRRGHDTIILSLVLRDDILAADVEVLEGVLG